ncbi:hypothetical protein K469DRAFT_782037 [Zopfia rhizophila CBS 207.26]|uniref:Uncharacterized protein n=1 Tax=Zopfia rhizophila CBS 207.26 TaxID=1314779 RepID=A0A6A6E1M8_9PEZI|nr:hypothetical protein K469DRAFT_782037 [Zopfia rhizophila CBS 207.26]
MNPYPKEPRMVETVDQSQTQRRPMADDALSDKEVETVPDLTAPSASAHTEKSNHSGPGGGMADEPPSDKKVETRPNPSAPSVSSNTEKLDRSEPVNIAGYRADRQTYNDISGRVGHRTPRGGYR